MAVDGGDAQQSEQQRLAHYGRWFIQMRWIAVVIATVLVLTCVWLAQLLPSWLALPLLLTIGLLAGSNVFYLWTLHRRSLRGLDLLVQVFGDLVILTILLHYSGGIENPVSLLMLLHVIIGGIVLSRRQCYGVAAIGSLLFGGLALLEGAEVINHYTLDIFPHVTENGDVHHASHEPMYIAARVGLHAAILFLTAYFVTTLADRIRHHERQLERMASRAVAQHVLLERSLETTDTALRVLDRNLQPLWTNARWSEWFGQDEGNDTPRTKPLNGTNSAAQQTLRDDKTRTTELKVPAQADSPNRSHTRILRVTTARLDHDDSETLQVVELAQDITEEKDLQNKVIRAGQLAAVGELAGEVAHEVNNPIAIISTKARLLLSDNRPDLNDHVAEELDKIIDLSDRVGRIAQGLLSSSRPSGAARSLVNIRDVIQQSLSMVRERTATLGIDVRELVPTGLPAIRANPQEMGQVFLNLLLNALDAMPKGGRLTISAAIGKDDATNSDALHISVEDTGTGIPEAVRDKVFQPFFTTKEEGHGTGLGLSICHGLITSHGGQIEVKSSIGEGTRITVILPVHRENDDGETPHG